MKIVKAKYEIVNELRAIKKIERMARICYKSESQIGAETGVALVKALIKNGHTAMLEHANIILDIGDVHTYDFICSQIRHIETAIQTKCDDRLDNKRVYLRNSVCALNDSRTRYIISGNIRAWLDFMYRADVLISRIYTIINNYLDGLLDTTELAIKNTIRHLGENTHIVINCSELTLQERAMHETMSVVFTVDRGVTHELVRMREASFAQESTRYCNYTKDKFSNEITVIEPCFNWSETQYQIWKDGCEYAEKKYFELIVAGAKAQEARDVLPTSVKADIGVTATLSEWWHIFNLRACDATGPAHPQMAEIMRPLLTQVTAEQSPYTEIFNTLHKPV